MPFLVCEYYHHIFGSRKYLNWNYSILFPCCCCILILNHCNNHGCTKHSIPNWCRVDPMLCTAISSAYSLSQNHLYCCVKSRHFIPIIPVWAVRDAPHQSVLSLCLYKQWEKRREWVHSSLYLPLNSTRPKCLYSYIGIYAYIRRCGTVIQTAFRSFNVYACHERWTPFPRVFACMCLHNVCMCTVLTGVLNTITQYMDMPQCQSEFHPSLCIWAQSTSILVLGYIHPNLCVVYVLYGRIRRPTHAFRNPPTCTHIHTKIHCRFGVGITSNEFRVLCSQREFSSIRPHHHTNQFSRPTIFIQILWFFS